MQLALGSSSLRGRKIPAPCKLPSLKGTYCTRDKLDKMATGRLVPYRDNKCRQFHLALPRSHYWLCFHDSACLLNIPEGVLFIDSVLKNDRCFHE